MRASRKRYVLMRSRKRTGVSFSFVERYKAATEMSVTPKDSIELT